MKIKKFITVLSVALFTIFIINVYAYATETRKNSLLADDNLLKDESNVYSYPTTILDFPNRIIAEFVGGNGYAYVHGAVGPGVLGISLNRYYDNLNSLNNFIADYSSIYASSGLKISPSANPIIELIYGMKAKDKGLAIRLARASNSEKEETAQLETEGSSGVTNLDAGLSMALGQKMSLVCAAGIQFYSFSSKSKNEDGTGNELENKGGTGYNIRGKLYYMMNQRFTLIPNIMVGIGGFPSVELTSRTLVADELIKETEDFGERSAFNLALGIGANYEPSKKVLLILGAYYYRGSNTIKDEEANLKTEDTETNYILPRLVAGVEVKPKDWLAARFGAGYEMMWSSSVKEEKQKVDDKWATSTTEGSEPSETSYTIRLGLGFKFGDFRIDTELNRELIFRQGPNVISGQSGDLLVNTSVIYEF